MRRHKEEPVDIRQAARRAMLRRLLLGQAAMLQHLAPNVNRRLRAGVHRRIRADMTDVFGALASERLERTRPRPFTNVAAAQRALERAGVPADCDISDQAARAAHLAQRHLDAEASGWLLETESRRLVVGGALVHASVAIALADAWGEPNARATAAMRHATLVHLLESLDPEPVEPLPIPPVPTRPSTSVRA